MIKKAFFDFIANELEGYNLFAEASLIDKIAASVCGDFVKTAQGFGNLLELQQYLPYNINKELERRVGVNKMRRNFDTIVDFAKAKKAEGVNPFDIEEADQVNGFVEGIIDAIEKASAPKVEVPEGVAPPPIEEKPEVVEKSAEERSKSVDEWYGATHLSDSALDKIKDAIANNATIIINYEKKKTGEVKPYLVKPKEIGVHHKAPVVVLWAEHDGIVHSYILDLIKRVDSMVASTAA